MKKVITFGVFDYFHLGHLRLFQNAKRLGDYLIVAVQDGTYIQKYKPNAKVLYTTEERMELVRALKNNRNCKRALSNSNIKQVFLAPGCLPARPCAERRFFSRRIPGSPLPCRSGHRPSRRYRQLPAQGPAAWPFPGRCWHTGRHWQLLG